MSMPSFCVELSPDGLLNSLTHEFIDNAKQNAIPIKNAASRLFWILVPIALVVSGIKNIFKDGNIQSFFFDVVMICILTGLFLFLLNNGTEIGESVIDSLTSIIDKKQYGPSELVDLTFNICGTFNKCISNNVFNLLTSITLRILLLGFMLVMFLVVIRFTCIFLCAHILCIAGVFVLGFGAFSYTRAIAVNFLKSVFAIALELMTMIIVVNAGCKILENIAIKAEEFVEKGKTIGSTECAVVLFTALFIYLISKTLPSMVGSLITNPSLFKDFSLPSGFRLRMPTIKK